MAKYFTADLHFSHPEMAVQRGFIRPLEWKAKYERDRKARGIHFAVEELTRRMKLRDLRLIDIANIDAHNEQLVDNINRNVGRSDELWIVGDLADCDATQNEICHWMDKINTRNRVLVRGNHDIHDRSLYRKLFSTICNSAQVSLEDKAVNISHFPYKEDLGKYSARFHGLALKDDGKPLIFGHTHGTYQVHPRNSRAIHVGLDAWDLYPVHEEQIMMLLKEQKVFCRSAEILAKR